MTTFQNATGLSSGGGKRGPQKDLLLPGTYYINPFLFKVDQEKAGEVKPGEVAVVARTSVKIRPKVFAAPWREGA